MRMVLYWRLRYAWAPDWMAAAISCIRALPAGRRRIAAMENTPYSTASTPAPIATHSHKVRSIAKPPPKKAANYSTAGSGHGLRPAVSAAAQQAIP